MATNNCNPPCRHYATRQVPPSRALSLISDYLAAASTDASLHPNALLTESGPQTPSSGTHQMGLVLHSLMRVEAGLKGEQLAVDSTLDGNGKAVLQAKELGARAIFYGNGESSGSKANGWQDKDEFEREQDIEQSEIGDRDNAVDYEGDGVRVPNVRIESTQSVADKEARKRKKERKLNDRKAVQPKEQLETQTKT